MRPLLRPRSLCTLLAVVVVAAVAVWFFVLRKPADIRALSPLRSEWMAAGDADEETRERLAARSLEVADQHPGTVGGLSALVLASTRAAGTASGKQAQKQLGEQIETADIGNLAEAFERGLGEWRKMEPLAPALIARARKAPDHPRTGRLLAAACASTRPPAEGEPPPAYVEAADLIAESHADSPDLLHFCEGIGGHAGSPPWAGRFERHLRAILAQNKHRRVRCTAQFALASVVQSAFDDRQAEAETLFEEFCSEFDGSHRYGFQQIEQDLHRLAQGQLKELRFRAVGKPAPEIKGTDLDGRALTLSEHRGRVVLLSFWGTWCFPCMKLVPHERELVARFAGQPFDLVGVNCDDDLQKARDAVVRTKMSWRSFRNKADDAPAITSQWKVLGYPTLYLIDHHGTIRKRWIGGPPPEELTHMVGVLVDAARKKMPLESMQKVVASLRPPSAVPKAAKGDTLPPRPGTGFLDKVHRGKDGSESKYVVFVPSAYDGKTSFPAILYLHGAGPRGTDGRLHLRSGLAKTIRERGEDFPFLVVFPQARDGEDWKAGSAGGRRALAILDQVRADYKIDPDRVSLTGISMGGQGTWSLAAPDPKRWAAIVPICHGSDTKSAGALKDVPCWCFHGDADKVIPVAQSREMIQAIQAAGGRPLYQEFVGVGHDDCADRAYSMPDLVEWLLRQKRGKKE